MDHKFPMKSMELESLDDHPNRTLAQCPKHTQLRLWCPVYALPLLGANENAAAMDLLPGAYSLGETHTYIPVAQYSGSLGGPKDAASPGMSEGERRRNTQEPQQRGRHIQRAGTLKKC